MKTEEFKKFYGGDARGCKPYNKKLKRKTEPTIKDIYWAAGIYEGEGYCRDISEKGTGATELTVAQKHVWILYKLKDLFGGAVYEYSNQQHLWRVGGMRARGFLLTIYSLLSPRRQIQALKAMALYVS